MIDISMVRPCDSTESTVAGSPATDGGVFPSGGNN